MTDFSVGDRVLVPGKVMHGFVNGHVQVRMAGYELDFRTRDLRPDTGGRDLTAQDIQDSQETWTGGTAADYRQYTAEYLNRIARGDAGSAGDDTAPDSEPQALDTSIQECWICGCDQIQGQPFSGNTEYYCVACDEVIGYPSIAAAGPRTGDTGAEQQPGTFWELAVLDRFARGGQVDMGTVRAQVAALVAAQRRNVPPADEGAERETPARAGDTAPGDESALIASVRRVMESKRVHVADTGCECDSGEPCHAHQLLADLHALLDEGEERRYVPMACLDEIDRLRDRVAELEDTGNELATAARNVQYGYEVGEREHIPWRRLGEARDAWRSAAGSPTTEHTHDRNVACAACAGTDETAPNTIPDPCPQRGCGYGYPFGDTGRCPAHEGMENP